MMEHSPQFSAALLPHVLAMDDVPAILDLLREILEEDGYRVTTSLERLDPSQLRAVSPDAILQEWHFTGTPTCYVRYVASVRDDPDLAHVPIILCTTWTRVVQDAALAEQLRQLHVRIVRKPFDIDDLLAIIAGALTASQDEFKGDLPLAGVP